VYHVFTKMGREKIFAELIPFFSGGWYNTLNDK